MTTSKPKDLTHVKPGTDPSKLIDDLYSYGRRYPREQPAKWPARPAVNRDPLLSTSPEDGVAGNWANSDYESAGSAIQQVANLDAERANLASLYNNYVASQQPPQPPVVSAEERAARPPDRMDWHDVVELARGSRYGKNIKANDPDLIAGWNEANRRRQRGE